MKITKRQTTGFGLALLFCLIQFLGIFIVQNYVAASLWDSQLGLGGDYEGTIGEEAFDQSYGEPTDIRITIAKLIQIFLTFLGIIFVVLLLVAGFKWMTSQGNENTITEAKAQIKATVIGVIIIAMSYGLTEMVMNYLYDTTVID